MSGKVLLENAQVFIDGKEIKADVYIHIKRFSLARVTHLNIESEELNKILKPKEVFPIFLFSYTLSIQA
jgi:uncharacterized metal-binding protein